MNHLRRNPDVSRPSSWPAGPAYLLFCLAVLSPPLARAADYGTFIEVETEEDLLDLLSSGEIEQTAFDTLVDLLHDGVDLNTATREELYSLPNLTYAEVDALLAYRKEVGVISDATALIAAQVLSEKKLTAVAAFLSVSTPNLMRYETHGRVRYRSTYVLGDDRVPGMWFGGQVSTLRHLNVGLIGVLTRSWLSDVVYDPNRDALSAKPPSARFHLAKFYVQWQTEKAHLVAGTYRIGFGQKLTFDNTGQYTPNGIHLDDSMYYSQDLARSCKESQGELDGSPCAGDNRYFYQASDYHWIDRLQGLAFGVKKAEMGRGWLQAYAFSSLKDRDIYQYELYEKDRCADPHNDKDPNCAAPPVFKRQEDLLAPAPAFSYHTLPSMFDELLAGGNVSYFLGRRAHLGVTGYGAGIYWLPKGIDLDFQEWSKFPRGGPFGAVGMDGSIGRGAVDVAMEVTRSLDSQPTKGGWASLLRTTATFGKHELELVLRYYHQNFANPYARPISAPDEYDGLRARNEAGGRLKYAGSVEDLDLRTSMDTWTALTARAPELRFLLRADYELEPWLLPGVRFEQQEKRASDLEQGVCVILSDSFSEESAPSCQGRKTGVAGQVKLKPLRRLELTARYQHQWIKDLTGPSTDTSYQVRSAWLTAMYKPIEELRLRTRVRYLAGDLTSGGTTMEQMLWIYLEGMYHVLRQYQIKLRYEIMTWLDDRQSTLLRSPNPAHWLRLELEYQF